MPAMSTVSVLGRGAMSSIAALLLAGCYSYPYGYGQQSQPGFYSSPPPGAYSTTPAFIGPGTTMPPGSIPPGSMPPPGTYPPGGAFPPGGTFAPPGGAFPPGGGTFSPPPNTFAPPPNNTFAPAPGNTFFPPGGSPSPALQPFGQPTPLDGNPGAWRESSPPGAAREPQPFAADPTRNYNGAPPPTTPRNRAPVDVLAPNPNSLDPFPSNPEPFPSNKPASRPSLPARPSRGTAPRPAPPANNAAPFGEEGVSPFSSSREPAPFETTGAEVAVQRPVSATPNGPLMRASAAGPALSGPSLGAPEVVAAGAEGAAPASAPSAVTTAAASAPSPQEGQYAYDRDGYAWLRGVADFDPSDNTWFLLYSPVPEEDDFHQGGVTLVGTEEQLRQLADGGTVLVEGRIDSNAVDRRNMPVYRLERIEPVVAASK